MGGTRRPPTAPLPSGIEIPIDLPLTVDMPTDLPEDQYPTCERCGTPVTGSGQARVAATLGPAGLENPVITCNACLAGL